MMREIKFRGLSVNGRWYYGYLSVVTDKRICHEPGTYISNKIGSPFAYQVRPETVGQYVGQCDGEGDELFEGDIIQSLFDDEIGAIEWNNDKSHYEIKWTDGMTTNPNNHIRFDETKKIGTIHENPELLEQIDK